MSGICGRRKTGCLSRRTRPWPWPPCVPHFRCWIMDQLDYSSLQSPAHIRALCDVAHNSAVIIRSANTTYLVRIWVAKVAPTEFKHSLSMLFNRARGNIKQKICLGTRHGTAVDPSKFRNRNTNRHSASSRILFLLVALRSTRHPVIPFKLVARCVAACISCTSALLSMPSSCGVSARHAVSLLYKLGWHAGPASFSSLTGSLAPKVVP